MSETPEKERKRRKNRANNMNRDEQHEKRQSIEYMLIFIHYHFLLIDTLKAASKTSENRQKAEAYHLKVIHGISEVEVELFN